MCDKSGHTVPTPLVLAPNNSNNNQLSAKCDVIREECPTNGYNGREGSVLCPTLPPEDVSPNEAIQTSLKRSLGIATSIRTLRSDLRSLMARLSDRLATHASLE